MKIRYNFDLVPLMAVGIGIHADSLKQALWAAKKLVKSKEYAGKLVFRDNKKCPKREKKDKKYECKICYPI